MAFLYSPHQSIELLVFRQWLLGADLSYGLHAFLLFSRFFPYNHIIPDAWEAGREEMKRIQVPLEGLPPT